MVLAELEIWHSRPISPTRRVALGTSLLPTDPAPGAGGLLLGAVVAAHIRDLDSELLPELETLLRDLEHGRRIAQPRLRHRFQVDRVGLARSRHRLIDRGGRLEATFDDHAGPASQVLGALYATSAMSPRARRAVVEVLRRSITWQGPVDETLFACLTGTRWTRSPASLVSRDPLTWALVTLRFADETVLDLDALDTLDTLETPSRKEVQRRFRELLRKAHPDHGGGAEDAGQRIIELSDARSILLDDLLARQRRDTAP